MSQPKRVVLPAGKQLLVALDYYLAEQAKACGMTYHPAPAKLPDGSEPAPLGEWPALTLGAIIDLLSLSSFYSVRELLGKVVSSISTDAHNTRILKCTEDWLNKAESAFLSLDCRIAAQQLRATALRELEDGKLPEKRVLPKGDPVLRRAKSVTFEELSDDEF